MKSWEDIGNTKTARKLIAATIRTCKIARYICEKSNITATSYISDNYLERVIETLWELWKGAGAVSTSGLKFSFAIILISLQPTVTTTPTTEATSSNLPATGGDSNTASNSTPAAAAAAAASPQATISSEKPLEERLKVRN
jgi:hypothetical protein